MKIHGETHKFESRAKFILGKRPDPDYKVDPENPDDVDPGIAIEITLRPVGFNFRTELVRRVPDPHPVVRSIRGPDGSPQRYDAGPEKGKLIVEPDYNDPTYQVKRREGEALQVAAVFHEGTRLSGDIEWSTPTPSDDASPDDWQAFYRAVLAELESSGISMGRVVAATKKISKLSGVSGDDMEALATGFTNPEPVQVEA